ncbi:hypothetical protein ABFS82_05G122800 [Erythranthe guttata]
MATVPGSRSRAGGKIVTNRRRQRLSATPYDRPPPPSPLPKSPNWFTGVVIPSARALASGAGKILSSAIFSASESSSDEEDSDSDDDVDNINEYESPSDGFNALTEKLTSAEVMHHGQESQFSVQRTETKRLIEQLVMQETFSREERDRLMKVLNSRVMNCSTEAGERTSLANFPGGLLDHEDVNASNKAVVEAKNWFQQKKAGSSSLTELAHGSCNRNSTTSEHQVESGVGSPVEVARSYMKEKVPWVSPTKHVEFRSPLTLRMKLFKEGTPDSVNRDYLSSSMRRNSPPSGSWNIQDELRRVRSKATEDMLRTPPAKIDPSLFAVGLTREESIGTGKAEITALPENFWKTKPVDQLMDVGLISGLAPVALESRGDGQAREALSFKAAASVSGINEESNAIKIDGECATSKFPYSDTPNYAWKRHSDPHSTDKSIGPPVTEVAEFGAMPYENGLSSSKASESTNIINVEGNCVLLSEAFMEVPSVTEVDDVASDSPNSLVEQCEESPPRSAKIGYKQSKR